MNNVGSSIEKIVNILNFGGVPVPVQSCSQGTWLSRCHGLQTLISSYTTSNNDYLNQLVVRAVKALDDIQNKLVVSMSRDSQIEHSYHEI